MPIRPGPNRPAVRPAAMDYPYRTMVRSPDEWSAVPAIDGLTEIASWAAGADGAVRSAAWQDRQAIDKAIERTARRLAKDREALDRQSLDAVGPSDAWRFRLDEMLVPDREAAAPAPAGTATPE